MKNNVLNEIEVKKNNAGCATYQDTWEILNDLKSDYDDFPEGQATIISDVSRMFSQSKGDLAIDGTKEVIVAYKKIRYWKKDLVLSLNQTETIGFPNINDKREVEFNLSTEKDEISNIKTLYQGKALFLDKNFSMNKFADHALKNDEEQMLIDNIKLMTGKTPGLKFKYRLIGDGPTKEGSKSIFLRSMVSEGRYKFFDNGTVLLMGLFAIDGFARKQNQTFHVEKFYITDSKFGLILLQNEEKVLHNNVKVRTGIRIANSEIAEGSVRFDFTYNVSNSGKTVMLHGNKVIGFSHANKMEVIEGEFKKIRLLASMTNDIYKAIDKVNLAKNINQITLTKLFELLSGVKAPKRLKNKFGNLRSELVNNSCSLLEVFSKVDELTSEYDDDIQWIIKAKLDEFLRQSK